MNLHLRVLINALAALVAVGGAAMFVPAAYSLLAAQDDDPWVFWLPGGGTLALGVGLFFLTGARAATPRGRPCSLWWWLVGCA